MDCKNTKNKRKNQKLISRKKKKRNVQKWKEVVKNYQKEKHEMC